MVEPVNLNRARKNRAKVQAKTQAAENRIRFGLTKADRRKAADEIRKADAHLDGVKREP